MKFAFFKKMIFEWLVFFIITIVVFGSTRLYLFNVYTNTSTRQPYLNDISSLFFKGLLFDIKTTSIVLSIFILIAIICLSHQHTINKFSRIQPYLLAITLTLLSILSICNIFFYATFGHPFDVFTFSFMDEDSIAILKTLWSDYPIIRSSIAFIAIAYIFIKLFQYLHAYLWKKIKPNDTKLSIKISSIITLILLITLGIRGSLGTFPLRQSSAQISPWATLNNLVPNAITALSWGWTEYRNGSHFHEVSDTDGIKLFSQMLGKTVSNANLDILQAQTPINQVAEHNKPNVVLAVMESLGNHMMQLDNPQRDLLGALRPHFEHDWVFRRFVSEGNGTSDSLHRLFIRSPFNNISQSPAKNKNFPSNMFAPYLAQGYHIIYITGGNGAWRGFDAFSKHLGVHEFIDETALRKHYPQARLNTWGVADEYMFRYAAERLEQAQHEHQPIFIFMMSVTNHPPYQLPETSQRQNFPFNNEELNRFSALGNRTQINEVFNTYRYANDQLGQFISHAKELGNTFVAATGDHNLRGISYPKAEDMILGHSVPFYLYVPQAYRNNAVYQPERVGSHKDIMPTLYNLSLSQQNYFKTGCNLTAVDISNDTWCGYGYNHEVLILPSGGMDFQNKQFHAWDNINKLTLETQTSAIPTHDVAAAQRGQNYNAFLDWLINRMITLKK